MDYFNGYAIVNGTNLHYEVMGKGEPLILLHSAYTDLRIFDFQIKELAKYFKVVRYDIRGFGKSSKPKEGFYHHEDLNKMIELLNLDHVSLLGISIGASIAIDYALENPTKVKTLILSGPSLNGYKGRFNYKDSIKRFEAELSVTKKDKDYEEALEYLLNDPMWVQKDIIKQKHLKDIMSESSLEWTLKDYVNHLKPPAVKRVTEIEAPTLLTIGDKDSISIFDTFKYLEANLKHVESSIINGTGHLPNLDKPNEFNQLILDFLTKNDVSSNISI